MSSDDPGEPRASQTGAGAPLDLMAVHDNLVPMIHAQCGDLASALNPVMFAFIDTCAPRATTSMRDVPVDVARALWTQGLQALRDIGDAALEPCRRIDAMSRLGLERSFCPDLAVLVFQFWSVHGMRDGRIQKWHSYEPRAGMPHRLQVELRAHGCAPVVAEWKVAQQNGRVCVIPPPPHDFAGPIDLAPPRLPTAAEVEAIARRGAENRRRQIEEAEAKLASPQLPTFVVQSPPLRDFQIGLGKGSAALFHISSLCYATCRELDSGVVKDHWPEGRVTLQVVDGLVVPTYYETGSESSEVFWFSGTTMVVNRPNGEPAFKVVVVQPPEVVKLK